MNNEDLPAVTADIHAIAGDLTDLHPDDFAECNHHELNRFSLALAFANSVLAEAIEKYQRRQHEQAVAAGVAKPLGSLSH
jgi:hypothetical protein